MGAHCSSSDLALQLSCNCKLGGEAGEGLGVGRKWDDGEELAKLDFTAELVKYGSERSAKYGSERSATGVSKLSVHLDEPPAKELPHDNGGDDVEVVLRQPDDIPEDHSDPDPVIRSPLGDLTPGEPATPTGAYSVSSRTQASSLPPGSPAEAFLQHSRNDRRHPWMNLRVTDTMGSVTSAALQMIINNPGTFGDFYRVDAALLGKGTFGVVRRATVIATGAVRAVKSISVEKMKGKTVNLKREINIMKQVDHPNLIMLNEIFEDHENLHLVMDLCSGGNLRAAVKRQGYLSEREAAKVMQQILRAVAYLHNHNICHRDIKALNCLLATKEHLLANRVKVSDFGLSCECGPNDVLTTRIGTRTHMAPEVWQKRYGKQCDLWSCGVVLYHILSGILPFEDNEESIMEATVSFSASVFAKITMQAVDFVVSLLTRGENRITPSKALNDVWFETSLPKESFPPLQENLIDNLRTFRTFNKFKRAAMRVIASMLPDEEVDEYRRIFLSLDENGDGSLSIVELRERIRQDRLHEADVESAFRDIDAGTPSADHAGQPKKRWPTLAGGLEIDANTGRFQIAGRGNSAGAGTSHGGKAKPKNTDNFRSGNGSSPAAAKSAGKANVSPRVTPTPSQTSTPRLQKKQVKNFTYLEFLAATFDRKACLQEDVCLAAFNSFDKNGDGSISLAELSSGRLLGTLTVRELEETLGEFDGDANGCIDFAEFFLMLRPKD